MIAEMPLTPRDETLTMDLDRFRQINAEVDAVVYLDFKAGTVLCVSATADHPQEVFDELCRVSSEIFADPDTQTRQATVVTLTEVLVLHRLSRDDGTALCLFFDPETPMNRVRDLAEQVVARLDR